MEYFYTAKIQYEDGPYYEKPTHTGVIEADTAKIAFDKATKEVAEKYKGKYCLEFHISDLKQV